jgi:hypothetical protein
MITWKPDQCLEQAGFPVGLAVSERILAWNGVILPGVEMHHVAQYRVR